MSSQVLIPARHQFQTYEMFERILHPKYVVGIVGSEAAKFTDATEAEAKRIIYAILNRPEVTGLSSGACHLGGVDAWAEQIATDMGLRTYIFPPKTRQWEPNGYKERNLQIVEASDEVHCITVKVLPEKYQGMRWETCYHCHGRVSDHVKSGGCFTAWQAYKQGKKTQWHII
jgi:hypothetical protein